MKGKKNKGDETRKSKANRSIADGDHRGRKAPGGAILGRLPVSARDVR